MKQVDKHFRDKLRDIESEVPTDMWDKIAPAIAQESDKTRPLLWFSLSGCLLLVTAVGGYFLLSSEGSTAAGSATHLSDGSAPAATTGVADAQVYTEVYTQDMASITEARNVIARYTHESASTKTNGSSATTQSVGRIDGEKEGNRLATEKLVPSSQTNHFGNTQTRPLDAKTAASIRMVITETYYEGKEKKSNTNKMTLRSGEATSLSVEKLALPSQEPLSSISDDFGIKRLFGSKTPQCPSFLKQRPSFFIDGYISHDVGMKSFAGNDAYASIRRATEQSQYSFGAGLRLSYYLTKNIGVRSGVAYQQVNERFYFDDPDASRLRITYDEDENGNLIETDRELVKGRRTVENQNIYRFVDIPLLLFYEITPSKSPFYYSVNAGVNVNLLFAQSGKYMSENGTISSYIGDDEYPNPYNTTAGVSLYTSFAIHYVINSEIDLMVEPHITAQLNPMTRDIAPVSERLTIAGVNTGIRYKF